MIASLTGTYVNSLFFGPPLFFFFHENCYLMTRQKLTRKPQPDAVFFHSNHKDITYRIWQLLDTQKKELLDLLLSEPDIEGKRNNSGPYHLPIYPDQNNLTRIDPEEPIHETGIYRDLWERKPLGDNDGDPRSHCAAYNSVDYTSMTEFEKSKERCWARRVAIDQRWEDEIDAEIKEEERAAAETEDREKQKTIWQRR